MLYESFIHPITILLSLPPAGVGALLFLMLFGFDLSVIPIIGLIMLIGIVKKNAIMMIDFALERRRNEGKSAEEAIYEAATLRFRPIMVEIGHRDRGAGAELRQPLTRRLWARLLWARLPPSSCPDLFRASTEAWMVGPSPAMTNF